MKTLIVVLFLVSSLAADSSSYTVDAKEMEYDGQSRILKAKDVTITFKNGAKLWGRAANLDFESMKGVMASGEKDEPVIFTGFVKNKKGINYPIILKSRKMNIGIQKVPEDHNREIITVFAEQDVEINYDENYTAYGRFASFVNSEADSHDRLSSPSSGLLTLEGKPCRIELRNGGVIEADRMSFDIQESLVEGSKVLGTFSSQGRFREVSFTSDRIAWKTKEGYFRMQGISEIIDGELGRINNTGTLEFYQDIMSDKSDIKKVVAKGSTRIFRRENQTIGCSGEIILDQEEEILTMISPKNINGLTDISQQAFYEDNMGIIYADDFKINYEIVESGIDPTHAFIQGNVRMLNRYIADQRIRNMLEQYALADQVQYSPKTKEMHFSASKGKRVLYVDKTQGVQLSAPGLFVHRRPDRKLEVQGKGNVKLKFTSTEVDRVKQYFPFLF